MKKPLNGIKIGASFKLTSDGKICRDLAAQEAKLDVSARLQRRHSKKVTVKRAHRDDFKG